MFVVDHITPVDIEFSVIVNVSDKLDITLGEETECRVETSVGQISRIRS